MIGRSGRTGCATASRASGHVAVAIELPLLDKFHHADRDDQLADRRNPNRIVDRAARWAFWIREAVAKLPHFAVPIEGDTACEDGMSGGIGRSLCRPPAAGLRRGRRRASDRSRQPPIKTSSRPIP